MSEKRTVVVSVRLSPTDLDKLKDAARKLWPGAILSRSGIILGLALLEADAINDRNGDTAE